MKDNKRALRRVQAKKKKNWVNSRWNWNFQDERQLGKHSNSNVFHDKGGKFIKDENFSIEDGL